MESSKTLKIGILYSFQFSGTKRSPVCYVAQYLRNENKVDLKGVVNQAVGAIGNACHVLLLSVHSDS